MGTDFIVPLYSQDREEQATALYTQLGKRERSILLGTLAAIMVRREDPAAFRKLYNTLDGKQKLYIDQQLVLLLQEEKATAAREREGATLPATSALKERSGETMSAKKAAKTTKATERKPPTEAQIKAIISRPQYKDAREPVDLTQILDHEAAAAISRQAESGQRELQRIADKAADAIRGTL